MTFLQVVLCMVAIGVAHANPSFVHGVSYTAPAAVVAPVSVSSQYHAQDALGQYSYGYSGGPSTKAESKTADGVTRGSYSYLDANGVVQSTNYVSDPVNGFRVASTNLPHDTPEVAAAKAAHAAAYVQAAVAAAQAPDVSDAVAVDSVALAAAPTAVYAAPTAAVYAAPTSVVAGHAYSAPGIVASANLNGGFSYSTTSVAPTYAPHYYSAVLPASTSVYSAPASTTVYSAPASAAVYSAPAVYSGHSYTAPGIVHSSNGAGGFSYSTHSYAPHYYSAVLPASTFPILPSGVPADTPEVAAAKAAHYAAHFTEKLRHLGWNV